MKYPNLVEAPDGGYYTARLYQQSSATETVGYIKGIGKVLLYYALSLRKEGGRYDRGTHRDYPTKTL